MTINLFFRGCELKLISSGGQGKIYLYTTIAGENLICKRHENGISEEISKQRVIEKNNKTPYAVQIVEVLPNENAIVMRYYPAEDYVALGDIINNRDLGYRLNAGHLILQRLAIYLLFADDANLLPHGDLNPRNILVKKDILDAHRKSNDFLSKFDRTLLNLPQNYMQNLSDFKNTLLNDDSIVVIDSWLYDASYDAEVIQVAPEFQSPEQVDNLQINAKSDIYQLGLLYYAILKGDSNEVKSLHPLSQISKQIPTQFEQILRGLTQSDPSRRLNLLQTLKSFTWAKLFYADKNVFLNDKSLPLLPARPNIKKDIELNQDFRTRVNGKALTVISLTPMLTFNYPKLQINIKDSSEFFQVPHEILEVTHGWIADRVEREKIRQVDEFDLADLFFNGDQIRIDSLKYKGDLTTGCIIINIKTSRTKFYDEKITNEFCNRLLPSGETLYEVFGGRYVDLSDSQLANPLAVNFLVVTSDGFILICKRGRLSNNYSLNSIRQLPLVPCVSGTIDPRNCLDDRGVFQLNRAVMAEYEEEVYNGHYIKDDQILYLGFARTQAFLYPFVYGMIFSDKTAREHENAERGISGIIECHGWVYIENNINSINQFMKTTVNQRNPDGTFFNTSDTLLFHLYRYAAWLNMKSDSPMSQADFDEFFDPANKE